MELAHLVVDILEEKKAESILLLDIQELASFCRLLHHATRTFNCDDAGQHWKMQFVSEKVKENFSLSGKIRRGNHGGMRYGFLLILGDVIVHSLLQPNNAQIHHLEDLWNRGKSGAAPFIKPGPRSENGGTMKTACAGY